MRYVKIGRWSSAVDDWTLCECKLSAPQYRRSVVTVPGRDGVLDLSDVLTGEVHYDMRKLTIRLENSSGSRENRMGWISFMVNSLDGTEQEIELPDDHDRVLRGRVRVAVQYNDNAHASVQITADVDPFRYKKQDTNIYLIHQTDGTKTYTVQSNGRKTVIPMFRVFNVVETASINNHEITSTGEYQFPDIKISHGTNEITLTGKIAVYLSYREGVL